MTFETACYTDRNPHAEHVAQTKKHALSGRSLLIERYDLAKLERHVIEKVPGATEAPEASAGFYKLIAMTDAVVPQQPTVDARQS